VIPGCKPGLIISKASPRSYNFKTSDRVMKLVHKYFFSTLFCLVSFSISPAALSAHTINGHSGSESHPPTLNETSSTQQQEAECPTFNRPNLDEKDGFNESLHKRKMQQIKRRTEDAANTIPIQKHNL